jgi:hypothetical protein
MASQSFTNCGIEAIWALVRGVATSLPRAKTGLRRPFRFNPTAKRDAWTLAMVSLASGSALMRVAVIQVSPLIYTGVYI